MKFGEKLRLKRTQMRLTQEELSARLGVSKRTLEGYEAGAFYPRKREIYARLSEIFGVDKNWFLTEDEETVSGDSKYATPAETEAARIVESVRALYAGGELCDADKDALARALMDAYWLALKKRGGKNV
ncbi:MAG: helix-turn-helix transcriptional regulator [Clostridia bacterium]|nr:helix-turn-helix transcriptional regulator [Clostridia bacterium]